MEEKRESLQELKKRIVANGHLTESEVDELRDLIQEGGMTKEKGEFLFEFKDNMNPKRMIPSFKALFINSISELLLEDEDSPGEIDVNEAKWLRAKLQHKGYMDKVDRRLLDNLRNKAINYPDVLNYKGDFARHFEFCLYFSRFLTLFAVAGSLLSAIVLFIRGTLSMSHSTARRICSNCPWGFC